MIGQSAAVAVMLISFPTRSALLAMGHQRQILNVELISTPVFYLVALPLIHIIGAMGANIAHIVVGFIWLIGMTLLMRRGLRRIEQEDALVRSEEHTSELQSLMRISYAVCCLKKTTD